MRAGSSADRGTIYSVAATPRAAHHDEFDDFRRRPAPLLAFSEPRVSVARHGARTPATAAVAGAAALPQCAPATRRRSSAVAASRHALRRTCATHAVAAVIPLAVRDLGRSPQGSAQEEDISPEKEATIHGRQGPQGPHQFGPMLLMRPSEARPYLMPVLRAWYVAMFVGTSESALLTPSSRTDQVHGHVDLVPAEPQRLQEVAEVCEEEGDRPPQNGAKYGSETRI